MKKIKWIILMIIISVLFTGCEEIKYYETISESDLIAKVKKAVYDEFGDEVKVEITSKKNLSGCGLYCIFLKKLKGSYNYVLKVTNTTIPEIFGTVYYHDTYLLGGRRVICNINLYSYETSRIAYNNKTVIDNILSTEDNIQYKIKNVLSNSYVFIYSQDKKSLSNTIEQLMNVINDSTLGVYVIDDFNYYKSFNGDTFTLDYVNTSCGINFDLEKSSDKTYSNYIFKITNTNCSKCGFCTALLGAD